MDTDASRNTYLPENVSVEKQTFGDKELTFVYSNNSTNITWIANSIRNTLITHNVSEDDVIKIIENIK